MTSNFEKKRQSYVAAKMKPAVEFQRELLIWVLNAVHMARLRGKDVANPTIAIERLLRVDSLQRAEAAYPYIKEVLTRFGCSVEMLKPKPREAQGDRFMVLSLWVSGVLEARMRPLEKRLRKERKLREAFEGTPRTRKKIGTDFRPENR